MKTKQTKQELAAPRAKSKLKLKNLALHKETLQNLSEQDATAVKGGRLAASAAAASRCPCNTDYCATLKTG